MIPLNQKPDVIDIASRGDVTAIQTNDGRFYRVDLNSKKLIYEGEAKLSNISRYHHLYLDSRMRLWIYTAHSPVERPLCYSLKENKWVTNPLTEQLQHVNITVMRTEEFSFVMRMKTDRLPPMASALSYPTTVISTASISQVVRCGWDQPSREWPTRI